MWIHILYSTLLHSLCLPTKLKSPDQLPSVSSNNLPYDHFYYSIIMNILNAFALYRLFRMSSQTAQEQKCSNKEGSSREFQEFWSETFGMIKKNNA